MVSHWTWLPRSLSPSGHACGCASSLIIWHQPPLMQLLSRQQTGLCVGLSALELKFASFSFPLQGMNSSHHWVRRTEYPVTWSTHIEGPTYIAPQFDRLSVADVNTVRVILSPDYVSKETYVISMSLQSFALINSALLLSAPVIYCIAKKINNSYS